MVAQAVEAELRRILGVEPIERHRLAVHSVKQALKSCLSFTNVPTYFLVLPTSSRWTVLWNNSWLCDGYDSLCYCLTKNHGLTTVHWSAHDEETTFQPGAAFTHRAYATDAMMERSVSCSREDDRWLFHQQGAPLPEEDTSAYGARRKRDRLNEAVLLSLLGRLGAHPWNEAFYDFTSQECFVLRRTSYPATIVSRPARYVIAA